VFLAAAITSQRPFPTLQAHLSRIRQQMPARHPQVRQRKQRHQLCRILRQADMKFEGAPVLAVACALGASTAICFPPCND
jgi:hypothetical protein